MMANDHKKTKPVPAPKIAPKIEARSETKKETPSETKSTPAADVPKAADGPKAADVSKPDVGETATAAPPNYSRGEGQKPVTKAYKENWNAIFANKKKKK
jgi:hypothetical protein